MDDTRLNLCAFPQRWSAGALELRIAVLPRGNPLDPLAPGAPAFADAKLSLAAHVATGLDAVPATIVPADALPLATTAPVSARDLFTSIAARMPIVTPATPPSPRRADLSIKKALPPSYTGAFAFEAPRTHNAVSDEHYACALRGELAKGPPVPFEPTTGFSWGQVLSFALRRPAVAEALGLVYRTSLAVDPAKVRDGAWLYVTLASDSAYAAEWAATPGLVKIYAARLPALDGTRQLFASTLFPVGVPTGASHDELFVEAETYDDGFAKIVHAAQATTSDPSSTRSAQPPVTEAGLGLAWDDEQLVLWMNRQIDPAAAALDSPLGVLGYRIDVRMRGTTDWRSLVRASGRTTIGDIDLGPFDGELMFDVAPTKLGSAANDDFWLPRYYATWRGKPLVLLDDAGIQLQSRTTVTPSARSLRAVDTDLPALRYGHEYEFRVRLVDLTGGGPTVDDVTLTPGPSPRCTVRMRRFVPPRALTLGEPTRSGRTLTYSITRPTLEYPMVVFRGALTEAELLAAMPAARASDVPLGAPDPDVTAVSVTVEVRDPQLALSGEGFRTLYQATREFPADPAAPIALAFEVQDVHDIGTLTAAADGTLILPSARDLRLRIAPVCTKAAVGTYLGNPSAAVGMATARVLRGGSADERELFRPAIPADRLRAFWFQAPRGGDLVDQLQRAIAGRPVAAASSLLQRLAEPLGLVARDLTLYAPSGQRVVFAASSAIRHHLAPDHGAITFSSNGDLLSHWVVAIMLDLDRDWTWDGLDDRGIVISRAEAGEVGALQLRPSVQRGATADPDRSHTRLIFFDAIEPKPRDGGFPAELEPAWTVTPTLRAGATGDAPLTLSLRLPMTTPPQQTPRILSAGLAMTPYLRSASYASTEPRRSTLWVELAEPPANPRDTYFIRMLAQGPDPLLSDRGIDEPEEPALPTDPELVRMITPGQSDDHAGLAAMTRLVPSSSPVHFLVPLPPELSAGSLDLLGFFTYELRVGHADGWSTAQGRFGRPLRVTGLQHAAPPLRCEATRGVDAIVATAPLAVQTSGGRNLSERPHTTMQFMLYAQVRQYDGTDWRNVLLSRRAGGSPIPSEVARHRLYPASYVQWTLAEIRAFLHQLALPEDASLSVLAAELFPSNTDSTDPLGADLGHFRILRTSPLVAVGASCPVE